MFRSFFVAERTAERPQNGPMIDPGTAAGLPPDYRRTTSRPPAEQTDCIQSIAYNQLQSIDDGTINYMQSIVFSGSAAGMVYHVIKLLNAVFCVLSGFNHTRVQLYHDRIKTR